MRRAEKEITDKSQIEEVLAGAIVCRLGLCRDNVPYVVPVNFGYKDNCLYIHTSTQGMKVDIVKVNPKVCFQIDKDVELVRAPKPCDWSVRFCSVIGFGRATIVEDPAEKRRALDVIMDHYGGLSDEPYPEEVLDKVGIIRIEIESMTGKKSEH